MTSIVFLDMDGVLNSVDYFDSTRSHDWGDAGRPDVGTDPWYVHMVDPAAVQRLNGIIDATGAQVVLSSSWRYHCDPEMMQRVLEARGFTGQVIARTPTAANCRGKGIAVIGELTRGHEIHLWLVENTHLNVMDSFVILDDMGPRAFAHMAPHLVQTSWGRGLLDEHIGPAIRMIQEGPP